MEQTEKYSAVGRRKEAVARVYLMPGKGDITINKRPFDKYFLRETDRIIIQQPLIVSNNMTKYNVIANVTGGGLTGQAGAVRHGISRALILAEPALKDLMRKSSFLTRDPRTKERKKFGLKGARKRFQWTKR
ncbi:MAG: 30S ribosomal protein S9 [Candidatus Omnitrophica bacterium]|nr:30S ribosomal protein S9 [Candidatus Omnitrophota bacterium]